MATLLATLLTEVTQFRHETKAFMHDASRSLDVIRQEQRRLSDEVGTLRKVVQKSEKPSTLSPIPATEELPTPTPPSVTSQSAPILIVPVGSPKHSPKSFELEGTKSFPFDMRSKTEKRKKEKKGNIVPELVSRP